MINNNPPFHVGQRVVCVDDNKASLLSKNNTYTVLSCILCNCGKWHVDVGIVDGNFANLCCNQCEKLLVKFTESMMYDSRRFAPIEPRHQDVEIAEELLRQPVEETLDVKPVLS